GTARWFSQPADVLAADESELDGLVAFVAMSGLTFLSPIAPDLRGIVCTSGSPESHLAILARELAVPCIMGAELTAPVTDGQRVRLELTTDGTARIWARPR
ncbi:MAG: PEP-utilizing enzyme, partial [Acidimicrobiia bacterium]